MTFKRITTSAFSYTFRKFPQFFQLLLSAVILVLGSCHKLVQDEFPNFTPVPTVNSYLVADNTIQVKISLAAKLDSLPLKNVDKADVKLFIDGTFIENLADKGNGLYASSSMAIPGKTYRCLITIPGYEMVTCSDSIPMPNPILKIEHILIAGIDEEGITYPGVKFSFSNNPQEHRYYQAIIWNYHEAEWRSSPWTAAGLKEISDPVLLAEGLPMAVFSNDQIKGDTYTMQINYQSGYYDSGPNNVNHKMYPFRLEFRSISYDYYQYLKQAYLYELGRYPEFLSGVGSVFPLHSNVQNGFGIFAGYSTFFSSIIQP
jgi:hypothetical protein